MLIHSFILHSKDNSKLAADVLNHDILANLSDECQTIHSKFV